ncbi:MAG TPA: hypothetical protein VFL13_10540 [Candidatus Baltobacteraceae bacterium]|nr:hypothetical protein [Candidatus Baltobacteraceae bacterium]
MSGYDYLELGAIAAFIILGVTGFRQAMVVRGNPDRFASEVPMPRDPTLADVADRDDAWGFAFPSDYAGLSDRQARDTATRQGFAIAALVSTMSLILLAHFVITHVK